MARTGASCTENGAEMCDSCNDGYTIIAGSIAAPAIISSTYQPVLLSHWAINAHVFTDRCGLLAGCGGAQAVRLAKHHSHAGPRRASATHPLMPSTGAHAHAHARARPFTHTRLGMLHG